MLFNMNYLCQVEIKLCSDEWPNVYGVWSLRGQNVTGYKENVWKNHLPFFTWTRFVNTIINSMNPHCGMQNQACANEDQMVYGVQRLTLTTIRNF